MTKEEKLRKARNKWVENKEKGIWQPACNKPDFRTEREIMNDFYKNGFQ